MRILGFLAVIGLIAAPALADWPHSLKWDQTAAGIDNWSAASWIDNDTPSDAISADDFFCDGAAQHAWVTDLEFYGYSYYGSAYINQFRVQFWSDVPESPTDESHPGSLLYSYDVSAADPGDPLKIGWQEIEAGRFKIDLPENQWFYQGLGEKVLWVSIQGIMVDDGYFDAFYWNFKDRNAPTWGDDAAFGSTYFGYTPWYNWGFPTADPNLGPDLYDGPFPAGWFNSGDLAFSLTAVPEPMSLLLLGMAGLFLRRR